MKRIDKIIVNTDSDEAIEIAKSTMLTIRKEKNIMQVQSVQIVNFGLILQNKQNQISFYSQIVLHH